MTECQAPSHPRSEHARTSFATEDDELRSYADRTTREEAEAATSGHLVRMIDFIFGLVLAQGLLRYHAVVVSPFKSNVPVVLALVTIYYTVIRSFVAWHSAIERRRYRIDYFPPRTTELWRVYVDVLIVGTYAYLLLTAEPLIKDGGANIQRLLWGFPLLFLLFLAWGHLRRVAWGSDEFNFRYLVGFGVGYTVIAAVYTIAPFGLLAKDKALVNAIFLATVLLLMVSYRRINFWQGYDVRPRLLRPPRLTY